MFLAFNEYSTIYYLPKVSLSLLHRKVGKSFLIPQVGTYTSATYAEVTIAGHKQLADRNIFSKSFLPLERNLLTFVERIEIHYIMDRTTIEDAVFPDCPIRNILARLCDKWSLLILYTLHKADKGTIRFKELQREIPDISQKMLTVTLRTLEDDGYVTRTVYPEVPPRVEYALTERTRSLLPHINALTEWALENKDAIIQDRKKAVRKR